MFGPPRLRTEEINVNLHAVILGLVKPGAFHHAIDPEHRRDQTLRSVDAIAQIAGQKMIGVRRRM
jgi:hypothetical protein